MSLYRTHVLPRLVNLTCGSSTITPLRDRVCAGLHGEVVEIGFGSGLNVPHYPAGVASVTGVEPADLGWRLARKRLDATVIHVKRAGLNGESLPFEDNSFDSALSTFTLCTIPDVAAALREVHRVLKPGGALHFLEHGSAPDEDVRRWQRRLEPIQKRVAGGCHLTREHVALVTAAGFTVVECEQFYQDGVPHPYGAATLARAVVETPAA
ncbi:methyltransferase domain-containing protein [Aldersonia sp. NBC_00410]|uniref:class I SAM-dependent methyltransferase n=1 Tax=Aldersonia sp. NBC_00410 TaxID=2975954 RepID=UPI0022536A8F|nr:class I SAM-dependent methyltransferase [Aldersonia sp. NBC_00410]MCX5045116.1 methyltransferase domain-containing protein [Aldersonia sp. NBC_00410]